MNKPATPSTPWRYAASGRGPARELASQARVRAAHMSPYMTMTIATTDGRLLAAPAIVGAGQRPNQNVPGDVQIAPPSPDVQLMGSEFMRSRFNEDGYRDINITPQHVNRLDDYRDLPLVLLRIENGQRVMVQAREIGYTLAVPFQIPRLLGDGTWLCIGGVVSQNQSLDDEIVNLVPVRVENLTTTLAKGLIGLRFQLASNPENKAHWITKATLEAQDLKGQSQSTLGGFNKATSTFDAGSVFCPLFSINADTGNVRSLGLQIPSERLAYAMKFIPTGASGTLL